MDAASFFFLGWIQGVLLVSGTIWQALLKQQRASQYMNLKLYTIYEMKMQ